MNSELEDRIVSELWKKYNRAKSDYMTAKQDVQSYRLRLESSKRDRENAEYWLAFYKRELEGFEVEV